MNDAWDKDYNAGSVSQEVIQREREEIWRSEMEVRRAIQAERDRRRGYIEIPNIPNELVRQHFLRWRDHTEDGDPIGMWGVNRTLWICHNCGGWGYKYSVTELFKCYSCRSRNVQIFKSGELSMAIRNLLPANQIGTNMQTIYATRRERMKQARRRQ